MVALLTFFIEKCLTNKDNLGRHYGWLFNNQSYLFLQKNIINQHNCLQEINPLLRVLKTNLKKSTPEAQIFYFLLSCNYINSMEKSGLITGLQPTESK